MTDVVLNPSAAGTTLTRVAFDTVAASLGLSINLGAATSASATYATAESGAEVLSGDMDHLHLKTNVANAFSLSGVRFSRAGQDYVVKANGDVQINPSPVTGNGTTVGTMTPGQGEVVLDSWTAGGSPAVTNWRAVAAAPINGADTPYSTYVVIFRVPTAPLRTGSLSVLGTMQDGTTFNVTSDSNGYIDEPRIKGRVNYTTGVVILVGVTPTGSGGQTEVDLSFLGIPSVATGFIDLIRQETLRFNAVAFTYLPLDATLLGINPVRLPTDGRVPIFKPGDFYVMGHAAVTAPATAVNGGVVNCGRTRLSRVRVIGNNGQTITGGYARDLEAGTVTWVDVTGYSQPVRVEHRIEDYSQIRDAQITGEITGIRPLTHDYPIGSYISTALRVGDQKARVLPVFDQMAWNGTTWSDSLVGDPAPGTYNDAGFPITVTNRGAVTERWALRFKTNISFDIIGEHVGNLGEGNINTVTSPTNPNTTGSAPYFTIPIGGFGNGWIPGNVIFFQTIGALPPIWLARTTLPGPAAGSDYSFTLLARGNVNNPL